MNDYNQLNWNIINYKELTMNKLFTTLVIIGLCNLTGISQTDVSFSIQHLLNKQKFALNQAANTPDNYEISVSRLQYYVSQVKLIHDGGQEEKLVGKYFLVDAGQQFDVVLGNYAITNLEAVKFSIGVENLITVNPNDQSGNTTNHADPSLWPANHPLAPKSPSMHWGWTSGYRFVALEGKAGASLTHTFEIHALGDANYREVNVPLNVKAENGKLAVKLDADYVNALKGIDVSSGLIEHSETGKAASFLVNFSDEVFAEYGGEPKQPTTGIEAEEKQNEFSFFPNPSNGDLTINFDLNANNVYQLRLVDVAGKVVFDQALNTQDKTHTLTSLEPGFYSIALIENGDIILSERLVVIQK